MKNNDRPDTGLLAGMRIGVLGMARSGIAAANLASALGARVLISDVQERSKCLPQLKLLTPGVEHECGGHSAQLLEAGLLIKSPGIPNDIPLLKQAARRKIPVWSEIEFAFRLSGEAGIVAITGTNGKTTTTMLAGEIFHATGCPTVIAGNIGAPLASVTDRVRAGSVLVLEVSSYQLEDTHKFHPRFSAILNVTPDHLKHHGTMANYIRAKAKIFANQTKKDFCVLNYDDAACRRLAARCPARVVFFSRKTRLRRGVFLDGDRISVRLPPLSFSVSADLLIPGPHNRENALAAVALAALARVRPDVIERTIASFRGVEHRIETVEEIRGVRYVNDSKATNVDSTLVALKSFPGPLWLILGGQDKGSPYTPLKKLIRRNVRGILLIGEAAPKIRKDLAGAAEFHECGTLARAVRTGAKLAAPGDVVLLSPACASFDQFTDYEDRGRRFKDFVRGLAGKTARRPR